MSKNLISECSKCGIELNETTMKYHTCKKNNSMKIYQKLPYEVQGLVLNKIFSNVKQNKRELLEELDKEKWFKIYEKQWMKYFTPAFQIDLDVFPNEVLVHKPLNQEMMTIIIQINIDDLYYCFDDDIDYFSTIKNISINTRKDLTYGEMVQIFNDEIIDVIDDYMSLNHIELQLGNHRFLEILELEKIESIENYDTYKLNTFMGS